MSAIQYSVFEYSLTGWSNQAHINLVREHSLKSLFDKYGDILWENGAHKYNVTSFIGEIDEILFGRKFSAFSQECLDEIIGKLRERGNSNATINRKMAALQKLLRKAFKMGDLHSLPEFRRQKERAGRLRILTREEEDRLFAAIGDKSSEAFGLSVFLVDTGCRLGEALGLKWSDLSDRRATFWITKSGRSRTVPLTERACGAVRAQKLHHRGPFRHVAQHRYRAIWNEAKAETGFAGDKDLVPHALRHTCASRLVQGGIDIRRVQMWLGHQTLQMTMRYAHLATTDLDKCVAVLEHRD
ncbi:MAG: site-specific integrase [Brucellaceae bacterium]|nr:site-specific integrase [Brucellaceae bacterium]